MSLKACKIPKSVIISGIRWKVRQLSSADIEKLYKQEGWETNEGDFHFGRTSIINYELIINSDMPPLCKWRTFCHELIHAIQESSGGIIEESTARSLEMGMSWVLNRGNWEY